MTEEFKTECGIFGILCRSQSQNLNNKVIEGLTALQHRGQESCGISYINSRRSSSRSIVTEKGFGFVEEVFDDNYILNNTINTFCSIGHVRYSTSGGSKNFDEIQPLSSKTLAISHNGNIPKLPTPYTHDTTYLFDLLNSTNNIFETLKDLLDKVTGAYCLIVLHVSAAGNVELYCARDRFGIRPLCFAQSENSIYLSSETSALPENATNIEHIPSGSVWKITLSSPPKILENKFFNIQKYRHPEPKYNICLFEFIYFLRPDSVVDGLSVEKFRRDCGTKLAEIEPLKFNTSNTVVVGAPFSGIPSAQSYAKYLNLPYDQILNKFRKKRTFILPENREKACDTIYDLNSEDIRGKIVVLLDDSVVRGNTLRSLSEKFREAGAVEFHVRVASPPVIGECKFGIDIPTKTELIAHNNLIDNNLVGGICVDIDSITKQLNLDSLVYLSVENMAEIFAHNGIGNFCGGCFTGNYPKGLDW